MSRGAYVTLVASNLRLVIDIVIRYNS